MSKKPAPAAAPKAATPLPTIEAQPAPAPTLQAHVGLFQPNLFSLPTHEELLGILMILGLTTRPFYGTNPNGDLVMQDGNVVIPVNLKKFFQNVPVNVNTDGTATVK